jgi:hypothetical protein
MVWPVIDDRTEGGAVEFRDLRRLDRGDRHGGRPAMKRDATVVETPAAFKK